MDRPERRNGVTLAKPREIADSVEWANLEPDVHVIALGGTATASAAATTWWRRRRAGWSLVGGPEGGRSPLDPAALRGPASPWHEPGALATLFTAQKPMGPEQITIPVRLSEAQHQRLKRWSAEHNFPMAVVVRGLIERFLDSWDKRDA